MPKPLNFEPDKFLVQIRPDQTLKMEQIKYYGHQQGKKIYKSNLIRAALDNFLNQDPEQIIKLILNK